MKRTSIIITEEQQKWFKEHSNIGLSSTIRMLLQRYIDEKN